MFKETEPFYFFMDLKIQCRKGTDRHLGLFLFYFIVLLLFSGSIDLLCGLKFRAPYENQSITASWVSRIFLQYKIDQIKQIDQI